MKFINTVYIEYKKKCYDFTEIWPGYPCKF